MLNINDIKFAGCMGADPQVRFMPNGDAVCSFNLAQNRSWKDANGEWHQETTWVTACTFRYLAEKVGKYGAKGAEVYVSGRLRTRKYQDKDGMDRVAIEIVADDVQFPGKLKDSDQPAAQSSQQNSYAAAKEGRTAPNNEPAEPEFEDSIPF